MEISERFVKGAFIDYLSKGSLRAISPLVERALYSNALRRLVMKELERQVIARMEAAADPKFLPQVQQDKADMIRALLHSADRALEKELISPKVLRRLIHTFLANVVFGQDRASRDAVQKFVEEHEGQEPPGFLVISPTKSCNLKCSGCYANAWKGNERLSWDVFDRIITEAETLWGDRFFTISGGEPLTYRSGGRGLLDMVGKHADSFFLMYTNGTLISEDVAQRMADLGNITPAISVEGFAEKTDRRRGKGTYEKILQAMENLRKAGVPFGVSMTAMKSNAEEILSDEYIEFMFDKQGALYGWIFQYMPIGHRYTLDLMVTPQQRVWMWHKMWEIVRERRIMLADFWNSGTVSNGCIAAGQHIGRGYLYIDWNGKVMPCTFVPYAAANINDLYARGGTLNDLYDLPYFRAIREWQKDYAEGKYDSGRHGNLLIPCSIRDHYRMARLWIEKTKPEPEDENAAAALQDQEYYQGMLAYDHQLKSLFDPIWVRDYLNKTTIQKRPVHRLRAAGPSLS